MPSQADREITFKANAREVRDFLIGSTTEDVRKIELTDGEYFFQFFFLLQPPSPTPATNAIYSGKAWVNLLKGNRTDAAQLRKENWLLAEATLGQIVVAQSKEGKSKVSLHLDNWAHQLYLDKADGWTAHVCLQFISEWWGGMMREWKEQHPAPNRPRKKMLTEENLQQKSKR